MLEWLPKYYPEYRVPKAREDFLSWWRKPNMGFNRPWDIYGEAKERILLWPDLGFGERYLLTAARNAAKYDTDTKDAQRPQAKLDLMLAIATDEELRELAQDKCELLGEVGLLPLYKAFFEVVKAHKKICAQGIPKDLIGDE